jgi:hypothetical protein
MDARCPLCTSIFQTDTTGIQACPQCGRQVNVAVPPPAAPAAPAAPPPSPEPAAARPSAGPGPTFTAPTGPYMSPPEPEPQPGSLPAGPGIPWEQRQSTRWVEAYVQTLKQVVFEPAAFFAGAGPSRGVASPLLFAWLTAVLGSLPELALRLLVPGGAAERFVETLLSSPTLDEPTRRLLSSFAEYGSSKAGAVASTVGLWFAFPVYFLVLAGVLHVSALVCGAGKQGFEATLRALGYGWAPLLLTVVPCLPALYATVLWGMGLQQLQRTTTGRATAALLLPGALVALCCCGVSLVAMAAGLSAVSGAQ